MNLFQKIVSVDYSSFDLSTVEQLVFIKLSYAVQLNYGLSSKALCGSCSCSKPTLHLCLSKLESLGFIFITRSPGLSNIYEINVSFVDSILPEHVKSQIETASISKDFNQIPEPKKLTKNQRKRLSKRNRW
jgi:hypothetical protein